MITELAYAKINLALHVMGVENGYHRVHNLMIPIDLHDELIFEEADEITVVGCNIKDNICLKAANLFCSAFGITKGVKITLKKNIPVQAGLAGGSSDAASTLIGLNKLFNVNASNILLRALAERLGSDVPFFIDKKLAVCVHYGEIIQSLYLNLDPIPIYLIKPNFGLSTKDVYASYKYHEKDQTNYMDNLFIALKTYDLESVKENIFNDLAQPALSLSSELQEIFTKLNKNGIKTFISGSGPTMFIVDPTEEEIQKIETLIDPSYFHMLCKTLKNIA